MDISVRITSFLAEKQLKFVLKGQFILITVCVVLLFVWAHIVEPGALLDIEPEVNSENLLSVEPEVGKACLAFILLGNGATALAMVTTEIVACVMRPTSTIIHPVCSV